MTGFGRGESKADGREFMVEIRTVNHRYFDIFVKAPRQLSFLEDSVRELVGKSIARGKVDVYISYEEYNDNSKEVLLDDSLVKAYITASELLRDKYGLRDDISVSMIARFPDVLKVEKVEIDEDRTWQLLKEATEKALESLLFMREREGAGLKAGILERTLCIEGILRGIALRAPDVVKEYKQKLESRIKELLDQQTIDEARLATEVAIFADRCSIDEEIERLGSHLDQVRLTLEADQPVGRKLDFLIQEMNREINTIGSKGNDLAITKSVVEIKSELEKMREQIQNIE